MKTKMKTNKVRIVKSDSFNYTFIDDIIPQASDKQKENDTKKKIKFVRSTLKDTKTTKTHYTSNSRSPKSQQPHHCL